MVVVKGDRWGEEGEGGVKGGRGGAKGCVEGKGEEGKEEGERGEKEREGGTILTLDDVLRSQMLLLPASPRAWPIPPCVAHATLPHA